MKIFVFSWIVIVFNLCCAVWNLFCVRKFSKLNKEVLDRLLTAKDLLERAKEIETKAVREFKIK